MDPLQSMQTPQQDGSIPHDCLPFQLPVTSTRSQDVSCFCPLLAKNDGSQDALFLFDTLLKWVTKSGSVKLLTLSVCYKAEQMWGCTGSYTWDAAAPPFPPSVHHPPLPHCVHHVGSLQTPSLDWALVEIALLVSITSNQWSLVINSIPPTLPWRSRDGADNSS